MSYRYFLFINGLLLNLLFLFSTTFLLYLCAIHFCFSLFMLNLTLRPWLLLFFSLSLDRWFHDINNMIKFLLYNFSVLWAAGILIFFLTLFGFKIALSSQLRFHTMLLSCPLNWITLFLRCFTLRLFLGLLMTVAWLWSEFLVDFLLEIIQQEVNLL